MKCPGEVYIPSSKPYSGLPELTYPLHDREGRLELELFQKQAAKRLGVSQFSYIGWEMDRKKPEARYVPAIIKFLEYDPWPSGVTLGAKLKAKRRAKGLTQRRAAAELGIDDGTYLRYERVPKGWRLARASEWLNQ